MSLELVPISRDAARRFIAEHHRHNIPPQGWKFGVGVAVAGELAGVATAGRPTNRHLDDGATLEVTRVCTIGTPNAASMLYAAVARAAKALGYRRLVTYTLESEPGTSLRAAGWQPEETVRGRPAWNGPRARYQTDLFGLERRPTERKVRWVRHVSPAPAQLEGVAP